MKRNKLIMAGTGETVKFPGGDVAAIGTRGWELKAAKTTLTDQQKAGLLKIAAGVVKIVKWEDSIGRAALNSLVVGVRPSLIYDQAVSAS